MENDPPLTKRVDRCRGIEEIDGVKRGVTYGVSKPIMLGEEGATAGNRLMPSPRRHKIKGLSKLGESSSNMRQSVRINARIPQAGVPTHHRDGTPSDSISDRDFINCNSRLCEPGNLVEPPKLWEIGKQVGLICRGDEEEVVKEYLCLEERDLEIMQSYEEGKKNDHLC